MTLTLTELYLGIGVGVIVGFIVGACFMYLYTMLKKQREENGQYDEDGNEQGLDKLSELPES